MAKAYVVFPDSDLRTNLRELFLKDSCLNRGLTKCQYEKMQFCVKAFGDLQGKV